MNNHMRYIAANLYDSTIITIIHAKCSNLATSQSEQRVKEAAPPKKNIANFSIILNYTDNMQKATSCPAKWVSSFLTAHQHKIGHSGKV